MRSACRASLFSQEHVCVVACHPCTCVCLCVRVFACVCASTVALNGFLNIASNDFFHRFQSVLTVSCSAFSGLARSSRRAFVYAFALEEKSRKHKHAGSASPAKVALTSFSCFLLGCPKHTHTSRLRVFPQRHLAACPRMTERPGGFF